MKNVFIIIFLFIPIIVCAEENNKFKFEVPNSYKLSINDNLYTYSNETNTISIRYIENNLKKDLKTFKQDDIDNFKNNFIKSLNNQFNNENIAIELVTYKLDYFGKYKAIYIDYIYHTDEKIGYLIYQRTYYITTKDNIFYITYTTRDEKDFTKLISNNYSNTFKIVERQKKYIWIYTTIFITILIIIILTIILGCKRMDDKNEVSIIK